MNFLDEYARQIAELSELAKIFVEKALKKGGSDETVISGH